MLLCWCLVECGYVRLLGCVLLCLDVLGVCLSGWLRLRWGVRVLAVGRWCICVCIFLEVCVSVCDCM